MLKKICCFLVLLSTLLTASAQVQVQQLSVAEALRKAAAESKIAVFILPNNSCGQCLEMILKAFESPGLGRSYNASAVTVTANPGSDVRKTLDSAYHTGESIGLLFVNADGSVLNRFSSATTLTVTYADELDKALKKKDNPDLGYTQALKDYKEGKRDFNLLYTLVAKKNNAQLEHDDLTEEMIIFAPRDSAKSISFIQFIAEQAPVIGSKTDQYLRANSQLFNDAWFTMPLQKRVAINRALIQKSKEKAIKDRDLNYARRVAVFTAGTYSERISAMKALEKSMLDYYRGVGDTVNFLLGTVNFYDRFLMTVSVDSAKTLDSVRKKEFFETRSLAVLGPRSESAIAVGVTPVANPKIAMGAVMGEPIIRFVPISSQYSAELNSGAWSIYTFTHDAAYAAKALSWAKRANEFASTAATMDTYARLLYRLGNTKEAIGWEEKAIARNQQFGMPGGEFESILAKMKKGVVPLDVF